jgi:uncharacterized damage-inducible protein DinB
MTLPLVTQLQFSRSEFMRCMAGLAPEDAIRRLEPMNCLSWMIGHMASQEQAYWVLIAQGKTLYPDLHRLVGTGYPASTPPLNEMLEIWENITAEATKYLDSLTPDTAVQHLEWKGKPYPESIGTLLQRNIYHYWFHTGEAFAVRQMLGHSNLPDFIGDMSTAIYRREIA